jgi:hypothetical protein
VLVKDLEREIVFPDKRIAARNPGFSGVYGFWLSPEYGGGSFRKRATDKKLFVFCISCFFIFHTLCVLCALCGETF